MEDPKKLAKLYPKLFKHDDYIIVNGEQCQLDVADTLGNSAPMGMLWVRRRANVYDPELDAKREVIGMVSIFDGTFYPITSIDGVVCNIPNKEALGRLFYELFPENKTIIQKLFAFFKKSV